MIYNELFINLSYCKILKLRSLRSQARSVQQDLGLNILPYEKQTQLMAVIISWCSISMPAVLQFLKTGREPVLVGICWSSYIPIREDWINFKTVKTFRASFYVFTDLSTSSGLKWFIQPERAV